MRVVLVHLAWPDTPVCYLGLVVAMCLALHYTSGVPLVPVGLPAVVSPHLVLQKGWLLQTLCIHMIVFIKAVEAPVTTYLGTCIFTANL